MSRLSIVPMTAGDWKEVARIYQEGIETGEGTFEPAPPPTWDEFIGRKIPGCCLVAREGAEVAGWAVLSPFTHRKVYAGVAEVGIYIAAANRGRGIGSALLAALIDRSEAEGFWTLQAVTFPENRASVALHEKHGFQLVGRRERIAQMTTGPRAGQWRDTVLLERRSRKSASKHRAESRRGNRGWAGTLSPPLRPRRGAHGVGAPAWHGFLARNSS